MSMEDLPTVNDLELGRCLVCEIMSDATIQTLRDGVRAVTYSPHMVYVLGEGWWCAPCLSGREDPVTVRSFGLAQIGEGKNGGSQQT